MTVPTNRIAGRPKVQRPLRRQSTNRVATKTDDPMVTARETGVAPIVKANCRRARQGGFESPDRPAPPKGRGGRPSPSIARQFPKPVRNLSQQSAFLAY